jgi:hypothetical protein
MTRVLTAGFVAFVAVLASAQTPEAWQQAYADQQQAIQLQYQARAQSQALYNQSGGWGYSPAMGNVYGVQAYGGFGYQVSDEPSYGYPSYARPSINAPRGWPGYHRAENGDLWNVDNDLDGRREPNAVRGYRRADGTYYRGHFRATPRR